MYSAETATTEQLTAARTDLNCSPDQVVLVSMGSTYKYSPFRDVNFFAQFSEFLESHEDVRLYVVGVETEEAEQMADRTLAANLHCVGRVSDPTRYTMAADYFIEPMPIGSGLAAFDTLRHGAAPVFAWFSAELHGLGNKTLFSPTASCFEAQTATEYFARLSSELRTREAWERCRRAVRPSIQQCVTPSWETHLEDVYSRAKKKVHRTTAPEQPEPLDDLPAQQHADFCFETRHPVTWLTDVRQAELKRIRREAEQLGREQQTPRKSRSIHNTLRWVWHQLQRAGQGKSDPHN